MKELDVLLTRFVDERWANLEPFEQQTFERLIEAKDPDLYAWLLGRETPPDADLAALVEIIRTCLRGPDRPAGGSGSTC